MGSLSVEVRTEVLCGRICDLEAENAELRNKVDNLLDFEHLTSVAVAYAGCDECGEYKQTMLRLFAENAELRKMVEDLHALAESVLPERKSDYITICSVESCIDYYSRTMPAIEQRMRELGVEVDE